MLFRTAILKIRGAVALPRFRLNLARLVAAALCSFAAATTSSQVTDPIIEPIEKHGLSVRISTVAQLPSSRGQESAAGEYSPDAWARVSYVRQLPDGRLFANDSRGYLYRLENAQPVLYLNFGAEFPHIVHTGLETGFIGFAFHPEFADNGLFYTAHGERADNNPAEADFIPPGFSADDVTYHNVITEWRANDPSEGVFAGSRREILRAAHVVDLFFHAIGHVGFNPTAVPGDDDYGLLYTSGSDLGFSNGGGDNAEDPQQTLRLDSIVTAILRIDPGSPDQSGGVKGIGDYTIPPSNPFASDGNPETLGEIYAWGFRNAHRLSWDDDGTLFATDIGMSQIEEINIVHAGRNYGWMQREGTFDNAINLPDGDLSQVYALPDDILDGRRADEFTYPVAMYDHSEGIAISGGFPYRGRIQALRGKFVFGDIQRGRLFAADIAALKAADDGIPQTVAPIEEIQLYTRNAEGERQDVTLIELIEDTLGLEVSRADLHLGRGHDGELFITSRQDGTIRTLIEE